MKTLRWLFILLIFVQACKQAPAPDPTTESFSTGKKHLVLMNPTVNNLRTFLFLTKEGIFPLPETYMVVGVFHESAAYDFDLSQAFIEEEELGQMTLLGISARLSTDNLFAENEATPLFREIFEKSEGIIFFGGPDLPPATYGEPMNLLTVVTDPHRHYLELSLMFHLLGGTQNEEFRPFLDDKPDYRILGICLGMQTMNVATGGTLIQDIPFEVYGHTYVEAALEADPQTLHRNYYRNYSLDNEVSFYSAHQIRIEGGHLVSANEGIGELPYVWSSHHQAAKELGKGLKVTAWSLDGRIAEAVEHTSYPNVLGVQFHPEYRDLYRPESKITFSPEQPDPQSFIDLFPGEMGETFHRNFWKYIAGWFSAESK
ncbi:MAG: gamma-glutamyl-gamma-aminobutyrate hydrolase family protein [Bacteroidales bacterium]|nr:gamma-glutamyl-gamma-aminobutyrate hydrolase family protein [Bacteroidales bacterium]